MNGKILCLDILEWKIKQIVVYSINSSIDVTQTQHVYCLLCPNCKLEMFLKVMKHKSWFLLQTEPQVQYPKKSTPSEK